ncbi:hypothetical protein CQA53_04525 [Helicobacter didelphidarum]|uniref:Beta-lactamase n=1 Tax=Helicobacter didelphidarum TaxID=2040648 RepID=A0A3D8ILS0_9HELI|nr:tetratricopeptide repeat protein [Helicobacter didelphidarum]RDU66073.1 hypothetical protein CQA53_04525 [Helicobacter didelphidarum]
MIILRIYFMLLCMIFYSACSHKEHVAIAEDLQDKQNIQEKRESTYQDLKQNTSSHSSNSIESLLDSNTLSQDDIIQQALNEELKSKRNQYRNECNKKNGDSCVKLAISYQTSHDLDKDSITKIYEKAAMYYQKDCENGNMHACSGLGTLYEAGDGIKQNKKYSKELYSHACRNGDSRGCINLGIIAKGCLACPSENTPQTREALNYFKQACKYKNSNACYMVAQIYLKATQQLDSNQDELIKQYLKQSCDFGKQNACNN